MPSTTEVWDRPGSPRGLAISPTAWVGSWPGLLAAWVRLREPILPYVFLDSESGGIRELSDFVASQLGGQAYVAEWQRWLRQQEQGELRSYISREAAKHECISLVASDWEEDGADLLFVVDGDLYDGESAVLPIVHGLTSAFPNVALDLMILPASAYDAEFRWGTASEVLYRRQQPAA